MRVIDLKPACRGMVDVLAAVTDDQLSNSTPCTEYTVGDLIDHVDQVSRGATALARNDIEGMADTDGAPDAAAPGGDWRDGVTQDLLDLGIAWDNPTAWEGEGKVPGSDLSNETWGKIALTELVVHGWDIARATGQPFNLPTPTLQACLEHVEVFVPNAPVPGLWGPPAKVVSDATLLDQIVAITGRQP